MHIAQAKHEKSKSSKEFFVELKDLEPSDAKQKGKKRDTKKKKVLSSFTANGFKFDALID